MRCCAEHIQHKSNSGNMSYSRSCRSYIRLPPGNMMTCRYETLCAICTTQIQPRTKNYYCIGAPLSYDRSSPYLRFGAARRVTRRPQQQRNVEDSSASKNVLPGTPYVAIDTFDFAGAPGAGEIHDLRKIPADVLRLTGRPLGFLLIG